MGKQTDFDFGYNEPSNQDFKTADPPSYQQACMGMMVCPHCGRALICGDTVVDPEHEFHLSPTGDDNNMDLSKEVSGKSRTKFENRDWIDSQEHLPAKGSRRFTVDNVREAKKKNKGAVCYVDLSSGKLKVVMSLRKGFTLDAFVEELGSNTDKWSGKTIELERGGSEGQYVNVAN